MILAGFGIILVMQSKLQHLAAEAVDLGRVTELMGLPTSDQLAKALEPPVN